MATARQRKNAIKMEIAENKICAIVGKQLAAHYPGWHWLVECTVQSGVVTVKNLSLHGDYGFIIHLEDLMTDTDLRLPVAAGGELLERCGLPRGPRPEDTTHLKRDVKGQVIGDTHGAQER